jgi:hypothetical protein
MDINFLRGKKGQVTLFVILAILIVAIGLLIYFFLPGIISTEKSTAQDDPQTFLEDCIEDSLRKNIKTISENGGVMENEFYLNYSGEKYEYLCYTNEYLKNCVVQRPMLIELIKSELKESLEEEFDSCLDSMAESFENQRYTVRMEKGDFDINLHYSKLEIITDTQLSITKDLTRNYDGFTLAFESDLYDLASIAYNILAWEATYGDASVDSYMVFDPTFKVEKRKRDDGSKIYIITSRDTLNKFRFASRSLVWPAGYRI